MKKSFPILLLCLFLSSCSSDDELQQNPYIINERFSVQLDLDLPQYNELKFPGNKIVLPNYGINGIVIYNINNSHYNAFELTDPNHPITDCSLLEVQGLEATCACNDGNVYEIVSGQPRTGEGKYSLKPYRTELFGNILEISN